MSVAHHLARLAAASGASCLALPLALAWGSAVAGGGTAAPADAPWGYRVGEPRPRQQGSFCARHEDALEIAGIFRRFGARTGFSALTHAPGCSSRVHSLTPVSLLDSVTIRSDTGPGYTVSFIVVEVEDGASAVLITTRPFTAR